MLKKFFMWKGWPFWFFHLPIIPTILKLGLKSKNILFFTACNPCLPWGGFGAVPKQSILEKIPTKYRPVSFLVLKNSSHKEIINLLKNSNITFPVIVKPDIGERGWGVQKIYNKSEFINALISKPVNMIVQEYISTLYEFGVLFHRRPDSNKITITSLSTKEFRSIIGDGKKKIKELVSENFKSNHKEILNFNREIEEFIPAKNESITLLQIAHRSQGIIFKDARNLINPQLEKILLEIIQPLGDFFYGRFDIKAKSIEHFKKGKEIKVLELNGTDSVPIHIFDPAIPLSEAYSDLRNHWKIIAEISMLNMQKGNISISILDFLKMIYTHLLKNSSN